MRVGRLRLPLAAWGRVINRCAPRHRAAPARAGGRLNAEIVRLRGVSFNRGAGDMKKLLQSAAQYAASSLSLEGQGGFFDCERKPPIRLS